jgi:hypothetical protein
MTVIYVDRHDIYIAGMSVFFCEFCCMSRNAAKDSKCISEHSLSPCLNTDNGTQDTGVKVLQCELGNIQ